MQTRDDNSLRVRLQWGHSASFIQHQSHCLLLALQALSHRDVPRTWSHKLSVARDEVTKRHSVQDDK